MSSAIQAVENQTNEPLPWALWLRQIGAIFRFDLQKNFLGRRSILIYLIALLPLFPLLVLAFINPPDSEWNFNVLSKVYAILYHSLILRTVVFFGCAWIFMNLFRGEIIDRSLHYYFLSAVRREVLVVNASVDRPSAMLWPGMPATSPVLRMSAEPFFWSVPWFRPWLVMRASSVMRRRGCLQLAA